MKRERATRILERICRQIDSGETPVPVLGLWVFGSYARGAMEPGDLDVIVVHGPADGRHVRRWTLEARRKSRSFIESLFYVENKLRASLSTSLRRPGENLEMLIGPSIEKIEETYCVIKSGPRVQVWSPEDRDWQSKLSSIQVDPLARSSDHGLFMKPKDAGCGLSSMEHLTVMLRNKVLTVERAPLEPVIPEEVRAQWPRSAQFRLELASFPRSGAGRKRLECLPFAIQWLIDQGASTIEERDGALRSADGRYRVRVGRLYPYWFTNVLCDSEHVESLGHLLFFKRSAPREILVFRRGPRWRECDAVMKAHDGL